MEKSDFVITKKIKSCIERLFEITLRDEDMILHSELTGNKIGLSAIDMTYLFFELEKEFGIQINTDEILNDEFNTIYGISRIIMENEKGRSWYDRQKQ